MAVSNNKQLFLRCSSLTVKSCLWFIKDQEIVAFSNLTITGALSGVPAYLPTDTAGDPVGVSYATNAPSRISAFTGDGGISVSTVTLGNATVTGQASTMLSELPGAGSDSAAESVATATATGTEGGSASSTGTEAAAGTEATAAASTSA